MGAGVGVLCRLCGCGCGCALQIVCGCGCALQIVGGCVLQALKKTFSGMEKKVPVFTNTPACS